MGEDVGQSVEESLTSLGNTIQSDIVLTVVAAVVILVATAVISRLAAKFLHRFLRKDSVEIPSSSIFINIVRVIIWATGISVLLATCFDVNISALVTALGVGGIALSLGFQDTISNLIGGLQVSLTKIIQPGDKVRVGTDEGIVKDVTWRHTSLVTADGEELIIPNSSINKTALVKLPENITVHIPFVLDKGEHNLKEVAFCLEKDCAHTLSDISSLTEAPQVDFTELSESGARGTVILRMENSSDKNRACIAVLEALMTYSCKDNLTPDNES